LIVDSKRRIACEDKAVVVQCGLDRGDLKKHVAEFGGCDGDAFTLVVEGINVLVKADENTAGVFQGSNNRGLDVCDFVRRRDSLDRLEAEMFFSAGS